MHCQSAVKRARLLDESAIDTEQAHRVWSMDVIGDIPGDQVDCPAIIDGSEGPPREHGDATTSKKPSNPRATASTAALARAAPRGGGRRGKRVERRRAGSGVIWRSRKRPSRPTRRVRPSPNRRLFDLIATLGLIGFVLVLAYRIFAPLFPAILWGVLLAVICAHPYERLAGRLRGRRELADGVFGLLLVLVLLLPALFFAWELILQFPVIASQIEDFSAESIPQIPGSLARLPLIGPPLETAWNDTFGDVGSQAPTLLAHFGSTASWLLAQIGTFGTFLFQFVLGAVISLSLLHYRFEVRAFLNRLLTRVGGEFANQLVVSAFDTTRAAFAGVIAAAIVQTVLSTVALYAAGLPALVLFAGFTFLLALVQVGPFVVLVVADAILLIQGAYLSTVLITLWFVVIVMSADNLVRPYFASRGSDLPAILSFLGAVGGFLTWGLIGVFLGPVLTAVLFDLLLAWIDADEAAEAEAAAPTEKSD